MPSFQGIFGCIEVSQVTNSANFFFVVALTALILSRDAVLVSCAFYFRYKSLPSPVSLVDCDIFQGLESAGKRLLVLESSGHLLNSIKILKCMANSKEN